MSELELIVFVVFVQTEQAFAGNAGQLQQLAGPPGVFGQYHSDPFQSFPRPGGQVTKVAKRRGHYPDSPAHR